MHTYTLSELAYLNNRVSELHRSRNFTLLESLHFEDATWFTFFSSDSLRKGSVVEFYCDFGDNYATQLHQYAACLLRDSFFNETSSQRYTLGQLAWFNRVGMFSKDMYEDLCDLGYAPELATALSQACQASNFNLGDWWSRLDVHQRVIAEDYIRHQLTSYSPGWPHAASSTADVSDFSM